MAKTAPKPLSALEIAEGLQLAFAMAALSDIGVFSSMEHPVTAEDLSKAYRLDLELLSGILEYASIRTNLVRKTKRGFSITRHFDTSARFILNMYACTYAGNASKLAKLMRNPTLVGKSIDAAAHARAFNDKTSGGTTLAPILRQLGLNAVLDIGCGTGTLLREMATNDKHFVGWGLDGNATMCKLARADLAQAGVSKQVKIFHGDGLNLASALRTDVIASAQTLTACQLVNEMFRGGTSTFERWLRRTRRILPNRMLVVLDYYGRLGHGGHSIHRETLLHDYAQVISGQGVPPPTSSSWQEIYSAAGCRLLHVMEDRITTRFVHFVRL